MTKHRILQIGHLPNGVLSPSTPAARRGFTIVELIGACTLMGVMFTVCLPMLVVIARERRSSEQRQFALQQLENLLEQAVTKPAADLVVGEMKIPEADPDLIAVLPGLERSVVIKPVEGEQNSRQIVASIRWRGSGGQLNPALQLSTWVFPATGGQHAN